MQNLFFFLIKLIMSSIDILEIAILEIKFFSYKFSDIKNDTSLLITFKYIADYRNF